MPTKVLYNIEDMISPQANPKELIIKGPPDKNRVSAGRFKLSPSSSQSKPYLLRQSILFKRRFLFEREELRHLKHRQLQVYGSSGEGQIQPRPGALSPPRNSFCKPGGKCAGGRLLRRWNWDETIVQNTRHRKSVYRRSSDIGRTSIQQQPFAVASQLIVAGCPKNRIFLLGGSRIDGACSL